MPIHPATEQRTPTANEQLDAELTVVSRVVAADGVIEIELASPDGSDLPEWSPGAHIDVFVGEGATRQYSLTGSSFATKTWRICVLEEPQGRGGSKWIHENAHPGTNVRIRGPRNNFPLLPSPRYIFIAGGIGITPILPMVREADRVEANWHLYYCGRSTTTMAYVEELKPYGERVTVVARDQRERLDLASVLGNPVEDTLIYCCGPESLLDAVSQLSSAWTPRALRLERFSPPEQADTSQDGPIEVELRASQMTLVVPAGTSILDAVTEAGIHVISSCSEGICGSCETEVLEGEVDHRDAVLTDGEKEANDTMMICVSRAKRGRLVLDL